MSEVEPPQNMLGSIMMKIQKREVREARIRFALTSLTSVISVVAMVFAFQYASQEFSQTGISQYFSLLFSDSGIIITYWKEFAMIIAETLPVTGIVAILLAVLTLVGSVKVAIKNVNTAFSIA